MDAFLFDLMSNLPTAVYIYILVTILPMRRMWTFVAVESVTSILTSALKQGIGAPGTPVNVVLSLMGLLILPMLFYDRRVPLVRRLAACAAGVLLTLLAELSSGLLCTLCGYPYADYDAIAGNTAMQVAVHLSCMAFLFAAQVPTKALFVRWNRDVLRADGTFVEPLETTDNDNPPAARNTPSAKSDTSLFATIPLVQGAFLWTLNVLVALAGNEDEQVVFLAGSCLLIVLCLAADVVLFATSRRYERAREEEARAAILETHLHEQMAAYGQLAAQVEDTARMRHDLRNHLQVLTSLVELGKPDRARAYVADMLVGLENVEEKGGR